MNFRLSWFDQRARSLQAPAAWRPAQLELSFPLRSSEGVQTPAWQQLVLRIDRHTQPVYLKRRSDKHLYLHADWPAGEPGYHRIEMYQKVSGGHRYLWNTHVFLAAAPLTPHLWLQILDETYAHDALRLSKKRPVPFELDPSQVLPEPIAARLYLMEHLLSSGVLSKSLEQLRWRQEYLIQRQQAVPLYRTRKLPRTLRQATSEIPLHTPVIEERPVPERPAAGEIHDLLRRFQRHLKALDYYLSQRHTQRAVDVNVLLNHWQQLEQQWQRHPFSQEPPRWDSDSLKRLQNLQQKEPAYAVWFQCARWLQPLTPRISTPRINTTHTTSTTVPSIYMGYRGFAYVYQHWCFQQLCHYLDQVLPHKKLDTGLWQAPDGTILCLHEEKSYPARSAVNSQIAANALYSGYSISRTQQPDMSLLRYPSLTHLQQDSPEKGLVFEVKFKQQGGRPHKTDVDRLHAYRDAVYVAENPLFQGGALLYPGYFQDYPPGLSAVPCLPDVPFRLNCLHLID